MANNNQPSYVHRLQTDNISRLPRHSEEYLKENKLPIVQEGEKYNLVPFSTSVETQIGKEFMKIIESFLKSNPPN